MKELEIIEEKCFLALMGERTGVDLLGNEPFVIPATSSVIPAKAGIHGGSGTLASSILSDRDSSRAKSLYYLDKRLELVKDMFGLKITTDKWAKFKEEENLFSEESIKDAMKGLMESASRGDKADGTDYDSAIKSLKSFYEAAFIRDKFFVSNIEKKINESRNNVVIVVTGGFHGDNLRNIFKGKGYNYVEIIPKGGKEKNIENSYYRLLGGDRKDLEFFLKKAVKIIGGSKISVMALSSLFSSLENETGVNKEELIGFITNALDGNKYELSKNNLDVVITTSKEELKGAGVKDVYELKIIDGKNIYVGFIHKDTVSNNDIVGNKKCENLFLRLSARILLDFLKNIKRVSGNIAQGNWTVKAHDVLNKMISKAFKGEEGAEVTGKYNEQELKSRLKSVFNGLAEFIKNNEKMKEQVIKLLVNIGPEKGISRIDDLCKRVEQLLDNPNLRFFFLKPGYDYDGFEIVDSEENSGAGILLRANAHFGHRGTRGQGREENIYVAEPYFKSLTESGKLGLIAHELIHLVLGKGDDAHALASVIESTVSIKLDSDNYRKELETIKNITEEYLIKQMLI
ncbi:hypothetical protein OMAG_002656 [Candidatus Omnitrophus magneticus]|uniref:Uncharacterized protein n=1 Tax=Candidatus Omnitrophus magneticus TaxID=1609969 RepID=A0A0F0CPM3_9BACT|nr:hypothetical protein OMAG_002656 [Candidatus Omnitrophus magneticus]